MFAFFGLFIIGFWIILDVVNYVVRLYDSNIIYINSHEEDELEKINKSMDGIEKYRESINQGKEFSKDGEEKKTFMRTKTINRVLNPIKEGLSDNTLKILKAWLKSVRDRHFKAVGMLDKDNFKYIPTVWVLFEMKEILMIPEQINAILFGMTYSKREGFLKSAKFEEIVDCLLEFEKKELKIDAEEVEDEPEEVNFLEDDKEIHENDTNTFKNGNQRRDEIIREVALFLTKSNEKWILDQFNLWKKFLIQNSIEGNYDEFSHPVYENFDSIKELKEKCMNIDAVGRAHKKFSELIKSTQSGVTETTSLKIPSRRESVKADGRGNNQNKNMQEINLEVKKWDIHSLLSTIEEIENKIKLNNILNKTLTSQLEEKDSPEEIKKNARTVRLNLSMLNYSRNFIAVDFAHDHPSDIKNKLAV